MDINKYYETITPSHAKIKELKLKGNSSILQARIHGRTKWSLHAHVPRIQTQNIFQAIIFPSYPLSISFHAIHAGENVPSAAIFLIDIAAPARKSSCLADLRRRTRNLAPTSLTRDSTGSCLVWHGLTRSRMKLNHHASFCLSLDLDFCRTPLDLDFCRTPCSVWLSH